jgi:hypothetical protein
MRDQTPTQPTTKGASPLSLTPATECLRMHENAYRLAQYSFCGFALTTCLDGPWRGRHAEKVRPTNQSSATRPGDLVVATGCKHFPHQYGRKDIRLSVRAYAQGACICARRVHMRKARAYAQGACICASRFGSAWCLHQAPDPAHSRGGGGCTRRWSSRSTILRQSRERREGIIKILIGQMVSAKKYAHPYRTVHS